MYDIMILGCRGSAIAGCAKLFANYLEACDVTYVHVSSSYGTVRKLHSPLTQLRSTAGDDGEVSGSPASPRACARTAWRMQWGGFVLVQD